MSVTPSKTLQYQQGLDFATTTIFKIHQFSMDDSCVANPTHRSDHYKIFFVEEGSGDYNIDFNTFHIEEAGMFFLSPGQVLTVESENLKKGYEILFDKEFYCVETHGKAIACNGVLFNNVHKATSVAVKKEEVPIFSMIFQNMIRELENPGKAHRELLETYLRMLLIEALRRLDEVEPESQPQDSGNRLVGDFIALVDKHFRKIHAVAEYAEKLYVSPKSLSKRLHASGYKTPTEVIRNRIVLEAKRDLRYTQKSVKEIAFDLGFDDPAYFTRFFKKAENQSPQAYRSAFLEESS